LILFPDSDVLLKRVIHLLSAFFTPLSWWCILKKLFYVTWLFYSGTRDFYALEKIKIKTLRFRSPILTPLMLFYWNFKGWIFTNHGYSSRIPASRMAVRTSLSKLHRESLWIIWFHFSRHMAGLQLMTTSRTKYWSWFRAGLQQPRVAANCLTLERPIERYKERGSDFLPRLMSQVVCWIVVLWVDHSSPVDFYWPVTSHQNG